MKKAYLCDIMDELGVTSYTIKILILVGLAMVFDGFDYMIVSYTMPQIASEWGLDASQQGSLASWSMIGLVLGSALSGMIADAIGRKKALVGFTVFYSLLSVAVFFVQSYAVFAIFRLLAGLGLGACAPVATTINSECAPTKVRGMFISFGMAFMVLGWVLAGLFAIFIIPVLGWRVVYLVGGLPILYAILIYFIMPESAMWYIAKNQKEKALPIIATMERAAKIEPRPWKAEDILIPIAPERSGVAGLFTKKYYKVTIGVWVAGICVSTVMYGINTWTPSMLLMTGFTLSTSYSFSIMSNLFALIGTVLAGVIIERSGRLKGAIVAFSIAVVAFVVMSISLNSQIGGAIFGGIVFVGFAINFATTFPKSLTVELYPTEYRATASAFATAIARIGGAAAPFLFGIAISAGWDFSQLMLLLAVPMAIGGITLAILVRRETKGISLDVLQSTTGKSQSYMSNTDKY